jgi:sigma-E factor negative regulatory protein RseA
MNPENLNVNEQISALVDGQLSGEAVAQAVQTLALDAQARANWHAYHLVSDVLRSQELAWTCMKDAEFLSRLRSRLQNETTPLMPEIASDSADVHVESRMIASLNGYEKQAANDANLRWKWVAGLASLALATVLGWGLVLGVGTSTSLSQMAQSPLPSVPKPAAVALDESAPVLIRDARLDQLLQAHQQFGGVSALQMPSGFVRNATFDRPAR